VARRLSLVVLSALCVAVAPATVLAQAPWTVTVKPSMDPLPVGFCAAVQLTVLDASGKDVPRNPLGQRVTMADFDMSVTGASVVGSQVDSYHLLACACQGGAAGGSATVTATYPARTLAPAARVAGVSLQRTATITLAPPKGTVNPPACVSDRGRAAEGTAGSELARQAPIAVTQLPVGPADKRTPSLSPMPAPPARTAPVAPVAPLAPTVAAVATAEAGEVKGTAGGAGVGIGSAMPGTATGRVPPYIPGPVTMTFALGANGSWYEPGPAAVSFVLNAQGSWYEPGPVTVTFGLSATGRWIEHGVGGGSLPPLQSAPHKP
jgi:hypothetical protein